MVGLFVVSNYRVDLNHAENHTFSNVSVWVAHLSGEHVCEALKILNELLALERCENGLLRLLLLHLLNVPELVLNHSEQSLKPRRLLCSQKGFDGLG